MELVATSCAVGQTEEEEERERRWKRGTERERGRREGDEKVTQKFSPTLITNLVSYQINHPNNPPHCRHVQIGQLTGPIEAFRSSTHTHTHAHTGCVIKRGRG